MTTQVSFKRRAATTKLIVHDTHTVPGTITRIEWLKVNARKRGLLEIGYHFAIDEAGVLIACRPPDLQGSHTPGFDRDSVGVVLFGGLRYTAGPDGEQIAHHCDTFTPAQKLQLRSLHWYLDNAYPGIELVGHTECGWHQKRLRQRDGFPCPALDMQELRCQDTSLPPTPSS